MTKLMPIRLLMITLSLNAAMPSYSNVWASEEINLTPPETQALIDSLKACDGALSSEQQLNGSQRRLIAGQDELLTAQTARMVQLETRQNSIINNPLVWFVAGMLVTGLTVKLVK